MNFINLSQDMNTQAQAIATIAQVMASQTNREFGHNVNENSSTMVSRFRDVTKMKHPMFLRSKVNEEPKDIFDKVYKILYSMGVISKEKVELASYTLKDMAQILYTQQRDNRALIAGTIS